MIRAHLIFSNIKWFSSSWRQRCRCWSRIRCTCKRKSRFRNVLKMCDQVGILDRGPRSCWASKITVCYPPYNMGIHVAYTIVGMLSMPCNFLRSWPSEEPDPTDSSRIEFNSCARLPNYNCFFRTFPCCEWYPGWSVHSECFVPKNARRNSTAWFV